MKIKTRTSVENTATALRLAYLIYSRVGCIRGHDVVVSTGRTRGCDDDIITSIPVGTFPSLGMVKAEPARLLIVLLK